jgi:hypothetical protein
VALELFELIHPVFRRIDPRMKLMHHAKCNFVTSPC